MINIKTDSRKIVNGDTFVAIKGHTVDGHDYITKAIENGATRIICEQVIKDIPSNVKCIIVENTEEWLQDYLVTNYKDKINELTFIGVTGTNGKTTTCYLTYQQLCNLGVNACYIGTIGYYDQDDHYELPNTTPDILSLYSIFLDAIDKGITHVVMEVSSHALDLKRVEGIKFKTAAFTNLTEDHLDYHKNMENYLNTKLKIINYLDEKGSMIINNDSEFGSKFKFKNNLLLGTKEESDFKIISFNENGKGTTINFQFDGQMLSVDTNLVSEFNVYNYLTSVMLCYSLGFDLEDILKQSKKIIPPKGRCDSINFNGGKIVVDYAHTPDAVEKIINAFKNYKRVITIVGCGGDRDPYKRPIMGSIASENSDVVIFTNDNPRTEDPNIIMNNILSGVKKDNYIVEKDRITAIRKGIDLIEDGDALLILGKGHEDYQIIGHKKHHLDDMEEVKKYLNEIKILKLSNEIKETK